MRTFISTSIATMFAISLLGQSSKEHAGAGAGVFQEHCIACHGPDGKGQTETGSKVGAADLTSDAVQQLSDASLSKVVMDGKGKMPAFKGKLGDDEVRAVIAYLKTLPKK